MTVNLHVTLTPFTNESRVLKETRSLVESGRVQWVHVVALQAGTMPEHEQIDSQRSIWRIPLATRGWSRALVSQLVKYVEFCIRAIQFAHRKSATIVTIHSLPLLPLGVLAKWLTGARLVYDCHELETERFGLSGLRQGLSRVVERVLIGRVDLVCVVSESIREWYQNRYQLANICTVMNCPEFRLPERSRRLHDELGIPEARKIVLYLGGLIAGRGIEGLLRAFAEHDDGNHALVFMGYGELEGLVRLHAAKHRNIFLKTAVPPGAVLAYAASADVGVSYIDNPSLNDRFCLPNKLFECVMAGLPVMVNDSPEQRRVVESCQIGVVLPELTANAITNGLRALAAMNDEELARNLAEAARTYSWETQAKIWCDAHDQYVLTAATDAMR